MLHFMLHALMLMFLVKTSFEINVISRSAKRSGCFNSSNPYYNDKISCDSKESLISCMFSFLRSGSAFLFGSNTSQCCAMQLGTDIYLSNVHVKGKDIICLYQNKEIACPQSFTYDVQTRLCFKYFSTDTSLNTYESMTSACIEKGGSGLLRIDSEEEKTALERYLNDTVDQITADTFIQGRYINNVWVDDNGNALVYFNWNIDGGQPNLSILEGFISLRKGHLLWHDVGMIEFINGSYVCGYRV